MLESENTVSPVRTIYIFFLPIVWISSLTFCFLWHTHWKKLNMQTHNSLCVSLIIEPFYLYVVMWQANM